MFQIRDVTGIHRPYVPGEVRSSRRVEASGGLTVVKAVTHSSEPGGHPVEGAALHYQSGSDHEQPHEVRFVREIMTSPVETVAPNVHMAEISQLFLAKRFRHLPVVSPTHSLVGIISDRDVLRFNAKAVTDRRDPSVVPVSSIMTTQIVTASPEALVRDVACVFFEERIGSMPVLSDDAVLVGIVTRSDILRALLRHGPMHLWA